MSLDQGHLHRLRQLQQQQQQQSLQQQQHRQQLHQQHLQPHQVFSLQNAGVYVDANNQISMNRYSAEQDQAIRDSRISCAATEAMAAAGASTVGARNSEMLARLHNLTREEQNQAVKELYGISNAATTATDSATTSRAATPPEEESPQLWQARLDEISTIADSFPDDESSAAYKLALRQNALYVHKIKELCLRADNYDGNQAASRLVSFFTFKKRLFGAEKLTTDIVLDDMEAQDMEALKSGKVMLLQRRDREGRAIIALKAASGYLLTSETWCRLLYYVSMTALLDEETQRKGVVFIMYSVGQKEFLSDRPGKLANIWWLLPVRLAATHVCYDASVMHMYVTLMSSDMDSRHLLRFRSHFGSYIECTYALMTFGIPREAWPINVEDGQVDLQPQLRWLDEQAIREKQQGQASLAAMKEATSVATVVSKPDLPLSKSIDQQSKTTTTVAPPSRKKKRALSPRRPRDGKTSPPNAATGGSSGTTSTSQEEIKAPGPMDIVMGRGRHPSTSPGHMRMQDLVDRRHEDYERASKFEKTIIANIVLQQLVAMGCRFVRSTSSGFVEECEEVARDKVSHAFRNRRKKMTTTSTSSTTTNTTTKGGGANKESTTTTTNRKRGFSESS
eukprot:CAMPEP_0117058670 /NCGR_PEP_ID=MMETSP0472-20121206/40758_1 /TAXON_ID=693140 ORGANISM="Tiarina fusus, Strain LIS" /NCGR_SAMPLE_ID=MMETSP0472 /ASSEMBLY_ACC=CAM_ASM_000603 /LENGTH=620 /DNA_ID=CAMNT_0004776087 /DNA_START=53 /DNA_END=1915 /DNA_ORIENTATION=-